MAIVDSGVVGAAGRRGRREEGRWRKSEWELRARDQSGYIWDKPGQAPNLGDNPNHSRLSVHPNTQGNHP